MDFSALAFDLVETAYEGLVDDAAFAELLEQLNRLNRGGSAALVFSDSDVTWPEIAAQSNINPAQQRLYEQEYFREDPSMHAQSCLLAGGRFSLNEFVKRQDFLRSRYYNEFLRLAGDIRNWHAVGFGTAPGAFGMVSVGMVHRHEELVSPGLERMLGLLHPHLKRVMALRRSRTVMEGGAFTGMVHQYAVPMLLFGIDGRLIEINAMAATLTAGGEAGSAVPIALDDLARMARALADGDRPALRRSIAIGPGAQLRVVAVRCGARMGPPRQPGRATALEAAVQGTAVPGVLVSIIDGQAGGAGAPGRMGRLQRNGGLTLPNRKSAFRSDDPL